MQHRLFTACALSIFGLLAAPAYAAPQKPNILIIVADDLGYGELSCQGNPQNGSSAGYVKSWAFLSVQATQKMS